VVESLTEKSVLRRHLQCITKYNFNANLVITHEKPSDSIFNTNSMRPGSKVVFATNTPDVSIKDHALNSDNFLVVDSEFSSAQRHYLDVPYNEVLLKENSSSEPVKNIVVRPIDLISDMSVLDKHRDDNKLLEYAGFSDWERHMLYKIRDNKSLYYYDITSILDSISRGNQG